MWTKELLGTDVYHLAASFVIYSMLGWLVESIYMSFCNKKLTNRGFAKGPFCPIYGFGAVACYLILGPLKGHYIKIYLLGAILATIFEYIVGKCMIRLLGELWWDYNEKPFNFQGVICLESTVAWGFYAVGIVSFLHGGVYMLIDQVNIGIGIRLVEIILGIVVIDYVFQLLKVFHVDVREQGSRLKERCQSFIARWY
ncbi:MAG: putative ABC transporter permease [Candidatus Gastranaerophilales bacterium]|nr:putative ABC transporter permease [Candidatus Gastranaerophilales bacterium]